jgi:two-component system, chemotaxis family, protein-glutamate methylesterase/glutaminase
MAQQKLRVLVIDDSANNRQIVVDTLGRHPEFEIVGTAEDGEQGLKLAAQLRPDLITLDIEMPRMDGFTFLRLLMSQMPTAVIVISSHSKKQEIFQALELGALEFIAKPARYLQPDLQILKDELIQKAMAVRSLQAMPFAKRSRERPTSIEPPPEPRAKPAPPDPPVQRVVLIGASTGGPPALQSLLKVMAADTPTAFLVSQHMPEKFTKAFAERLNRSANLNVLEAEDGQRVVPGTAYVAPGGSHMELTETKEGLSVTLVKPQKEDRYTPSIDRLFASAAKARSAKLLGVVLTGMGADGASGIKNLHAAGARTMAESQESAIVFGMPKEAILTGCIQEVLPLETIIERVHLFALGVGK